MTDAAMTGGWYSRVDSMEGMHRGSGVVGYQKQFLITGNHVTRYYVPALPRQTSVVTDC